MGEDVRDFKGAEGGPLMLRKLLRLKHYETSFIVFEKSNFVFKQPMTTLLSANISCVRFSCRYLIALMTIGYYLL